jgi:2-polyprenyl-3-methyl-5-hydroxy-6-metoxy-1,4-benzoquinol methylase
MESSQDPRELDIIHSWHVNAGAWSDAIRTSSIASRTLVTNQAIIDAVSSVAPRRLLDLGCGEGWLVRALSTRGMSVVGVDIVPDLIARAAALGGGEFQVQDYASIANRQAHLGAFDAVVCNFSLLGEQSVESLIAALPFYLNHPGYLIVQTLHPVSACGDHPYRNGWREGSWLGFGSDFSNPAPWYFRTVESWSAMLERCAFDILECREPRADAAALPASQIWIGRARRSAQTLR